MSNQIYPISLSEMYIYNPPSVIELNRFNRSESIVIGTPIYPHNAVRRCSNRLLLWCLVPFEIPVSILHLISCMGCCGKYGNPITPLIEDIPYDAFYTDRYEKAASCLTSTIYGLIHCIAAACTCCGCFGMSFSPAESCNIR